jgi:hypothetical protein
MQTCPPKSLPAEGGRSIFFSPTYFPKNVFLPLPLPAGRFSAKRAKQNFAHLAFFASLSAVRQVCVKQKK